MVHKVYVTYNQVSSRKRVVLTNAVRLTALA